MSTPNPFGAGPPIRTPAFEFNLNIPGVRPLKLELYWTRPWLTWLNAIQTQANTTTDLEVIAAFESASVAASRGQQAQELAQSAIQLIPAARKPVAPSDEAIAALLARIAKNGMPTAEELAVLVACVRSRRPGSGHVFIQDTHANAGLYPAAAYPDGSFRRETDRTVLYMALSGAWIYVAGIYHATLSSIPADLTNNDAGFLFDCTDYWHTLRWLSGGSWTWGPGEIGSGYYQLFEAAPNTPAANAWQICDGSTVARLNADGTTSNVTLDDLTAAAYLKGSTTSAAVAAASGATTSVSAGTPAGTNSSPDTGNDTDAGFLAAADAITGTDVALRPHVHTTTAPVFTGAALAGHSHGPNTIELRNKQARLYFRR